jgi:dihydrofolate synthase/folylpolyglutamate synthase
LAVSDLELITQDLDLSHKIFPTVESAFLAAKSQAHADDFIYIGGSTFVVAEIL